MRQRKRMWIDVDEVLNEYRPTVVELANRHLGKTLDPKDHPGTTWDIFEMFASEEVEQLFEFVRAPGFCDSLPVREGAKEAVEALRQHVDLYVVTSPFYSSPTWVFERTNWLKSHFGFDSKQIVHTSAKYLVDADICLDDKHSNVFRWHEHHPDGLAMLWPTYHTRNIPTPDGYWVRDWQDVIERVVAHVNKPTSLDLLDEREFTHEEFLGGSSNYCQECGASERDGRLPKHRPNCRLDEILTRYRNGVT